MNTIRNIVKVGTEGEYRSLLMSGKLPMPHVVGIAETGRTVISGNEVTRDTAMPGDFICFNHGNEMKIVRKEDYENIPAGYNVEAIVVAPSANSPKGDGSLVCVSVGKITVSGNDGEVSEFSAYVGSEYSNYSGIVNTSGTTTETAYLPTDIFMEKGRASYAPEATELTLVQSPYTAGLEYNTEYGESFPFEDEELNVLVPVDSRRANFQIINSGGRMTSNCMFNVAIGYRTLHLVEGRWFVPSMYEIGHFVNRYEMIKASMDAVNGGVSDPEAPTELVALNGIMAPDGNAYIWKVDLSDCSVYTVKVEANTETGGFESGAYKMYAFIYI